MTLTKVRFDNGGTNVTATRKCLRYLCELDSAYDNTSILNVSE